VGTAEGCKETFLFEELRTKAHGYWPSHVRPKFWGNPKW